MLLPPSESSGGFLNPFRRFAGIKEASSTTTGVGVAFVLMSFIDLRSDFCLNFFLILFHVFESAILLPE